MQSLLQLLNYTSNVKEAIENILTNKWNYVKIKLAL